MNKSTVRRAIVLIGDKHSVGRFIWRGERGLCYCILGAMMAADGAPIREYKDSQAVSIDLRFDEVQRLCDEAARVLGFENGNLVVKFNDTHTTEQVVERMRAAL